MKVLILGASGLVGGNCLRYFREHTSWDCEGTHFSFPTADTYFYNTLDQADANNFDVEGFAPEVILHAGALTHVDYCEENEQESFEKTVLSTQSVVTLAVKLKAKVIYISSDYVFDGKDGPYEETAPFNPLSVYGRHKLEAEDLVRENIAHHLILRVTNVYGNEERNKNFIARIVEAVREGKSLTLNLPSDQYATPANALDIARMLHVLIRDRKKGVYHVASTDYLNRVQLAQRILRHFPQNRVEIVPKMTNDLNQPAARPLQGGLKAAKFLAEYPGFAFSNVDDYLAELKNAL